MPGSSKRRRGGPRSIRNFEEGPAYVAQALPGLVPFAAAELTGADFRVETVGDEEVRFRFTGSVDRLLRLRRTVAVYRLLHFDVPRPRALTGHAHLKRLLSLIESVRSGPEGNDFAGFRFSAAGSDSPAFNRLAQEIERETGLPHRPDDGELLMRVRPAEAGGWEVLARLTPRPLSARSWRECNLEGGLNATVAVAANDLLGSGQRDRYLNLMCGSGTLLIERALSGGWQVGVGVDIDPAAVACCLANCRGAGLERRTEVIAADAVSLDFPAGSFDRLSADLPWGDAVGAHRENEVLYPRFLSESARLAAPRARLVVITHELRLFERALSDQQAWRQRELRRVFHGGHRPGIYVLERRR